ncbi:DUF2589 domain-containing protein [Ideonella sp.]|jgi:hypothetical protein|uniref:DUF2589 domain-containing protein n=1 Tax=Ideonella sp. TaxID=1929293 RepID=UPI0037C07263
MADSIDTGLLSMAQQFSGLPMKSLIGGPLQAAAEAQQSLAMTQTNYILNTGFSRVEKNGALVGYKPITAAIEMNGTRPVVDKDGKVTAANSALTMDFPILTMMPIPSLAVTAVDITFDMEVKSSYTHETEDQSKTKDHAEGSFDAKAGWGCFSVEVKGAISHDSETSHTDKQSYQKSNSARYHVEVKAEQQPIPDGIKMLLTMFGKNMELAMQPVQTA